MGSVEVTSARRLPSGPTSTSSRGGVGSPAKVRTTGSSSNGKGRPARSSTRIWPRLSRQLSLITPSESPSARPRRLMLVNRAGAGHDDDADGQVHLDENGQLRVLDVGGAA